MKTTSKLVTIALTLMIAMMVVIMIAAPVSAQDAVCPNAPPAAYFTTDGPMNGQPVHDGLQLGYVWSITEQSRIDHFSGSHYLGFDRGTYALKFSHNEQEWTRFGQYYYCYSLPDFEYQPDETGVSENPFTSTYEPAHASGIFR